MYPNIYKYVIHILKSLIQTIIKIYDSILKSSPVKYLITFRFNKIFRVIL